ncbi:Prolyl 4-hydroxylase subunit alpha-2 like protein [Argiope bruennichi]|uniref:procollagen-proline 4-dioxygenase n=1 Tax=Argiope bruennichi TaxID=94029 RepID=A0A8T0FE48_ARGBR|nr:Prolyl 4-hydroxylase subunit alpha-2 like protein [Argiope bruennichi]
MGSTSLRSLATIRTIRIPLLSPPLPVYAPRSSKNRMLRWVVVTIAVVTIGARGDIFSSTAHLQNLLHLERHLVTTLHDYVDKTEDKLNQVKRYLNLFYDSYQEVLEQKLPAPADGDEMVANPLQAFQLVRRLSVDWGFIKSAMNTDDWRPIRKLVSDYRQLMPSKDDLQGAALALVRLQDTYRLNMTDVARGEVLGIPQGTSLSAAPVCSWKNSLLAGTAHATVGFKSHKSHLEGKPAQLVVQVMAFYASAVDMDYDTFGHPLKSNRSSAVLLGRRNVFRLGNDITPMEEQENYMALCRGERLVSVAQESKLVCRLDNKGHPYLLLRPLRIEERSLDPYVVMYHDLLTEAQTELLKQIAEPKLARSMVQAGKGSEVVSVSRTSQNAWIGPHDHPFMAKVYRLVEFVTGLSTDVDKEHAEIVQVANYGMGGHYTPHHDYLLVDKDPEEMKYVHPKEIEAGDRTATLMFYLTDVTRGGATVFPRVGAGVWPRRGSAVFWYNLKQNGKENPLTLHGACPVAIGSKWVANFWIREKGQLFRRRCALDPEL